MTIEIGTRVLVVGAAIADGGEGGGTSGGGDVRTKRTGLELRRHHLERRRMTVSLKSKWASAPTEDGSDLSPVGFLGGLILAKPDVFQQIASVRSRFHYAHLFPVDYGLASFPLFKKFNNFQKYSSIHSPHSNQLSYTLLQIFISYTKLFEK